ncbi:MAG TPA: DUF1553 domain-containing protein [Bryobacteraceae bacterium]|nr:DUF1553 domain-containing protein [Bryobacteraceae bacterium]
MPKPSPLLLLVLLSTPAPATIDFQRQVRPILSDACFLCHGPDKGTRMADLRLDTREGAFEARKNGKLIQPGDPKASLLYRRITHEKPALRMPPVHTKKSLTESQKEILGKWIAEGAEWKEHWSFQPPVKRPPPVVRNKAWGRTPIDNFILAKLEAARLTPALDADRRTLIRRVTLDLTGLPPTPEEIDSFLKDRNPKAYEKVVDRLLSSNRWGEHRGRFWLDAARYADTHGLHIDNYREMWLYRDWVINAFNRNLPFDRFTIEQLAGDMLPNRTLEQQIASGFNRCNITTNEGGSIPEEVDAMYQKDRVETTSTVWLGLTTGCATCHDHKFDPIAQKEFYQMVAFFKNTTQKPLDGNIQDTPPILFVPLEEDRTRWQLLNERSTELRARKEQLQSEASQSAIPEIEPPAGVSLPLPALPPEVTQQAGPSEKISALKFNGKAALEIPDIPLADPSQPFTLSAWVYVPGDEALVVASHTDSKTQSQGWILDITTRQPRFVWMHPGLTPKPQIRGNPQQRLRAKAWSHIAVTYDGSREEAGLTIYVNGTPLTTERVYSDPSEEIKPADPSRIAFRMGSDGKRSLKGGALADLRFYRQALGDDLIEALSKWNTSSHARAQMLFFVNRTNAAYQVAAAQLDEVEKQRREVRRRGAVTHVMQENANSKPVARILYRGQYDQPREEVSANVPSVLPPMSSELPRNRFGLAQWIIDPSNPLTARVTVNRFWQELFGTGLVKTAEDFGSQGEAPANPELLDWMAVEFRESGWDIKAFYRLLVTSSTYRQALTVTPEKLKKDPENRLLSRGPRFRMDAEMVRDFALASSGLLTEKIGGPSVRPYQPEGIWETVAMKSSTTRFYKRDHGDSLYRRSLYTFWKRSAPPASMEIFNAPSRENCTVRRERTNTPLQALVTLNDVQYVEAARRLAERAFTKPTFDTRLDFITTQVIARPFETRERAVVRSAYKDFLAYYTGRESDAVKLISTGESKPEQNLPAAELAAWTMVANQVLNLDEALNK